jgi:RNA polymerase sporulation-specific sigma factor
MNVKSEELLSDLEWEVLTSYLQGKSYQEIAAELDQTCQIHR